MQSTSTFELTERVATECPLAPEDLEFLLAEHRAHVQITPTVRPGCYRLTPAGHVGVIVAPSCRLVIRPKIPLSNLFHLFDLGIPVQAAVDQSTPLPGAEAIEFLAGRMVQLMAERSALGLHRAYIERAEQGPFLQGRLDVPAHLREPAARKDRLHVRYEEFSADTPCNQVPKATAELLLQSPLLGEGMRAALHRELRAFAAVHSIPLGPDTFATLQMDRLTEPYQPLLDLCRLLFESLAPGSDAGPIRCPAFLLDMERIFERYVTEGVRRALAGSPYTVAAQPLFSVSLPEPGRPDLQMRPDVVIRDGHAPLLVLDAKWKRLPRSPLVTTDVYQVLAYCAALGVRSGVLVYAGPRDRRWVVPLTHTPIVVEIRTLRVIGSRKMCQRSLLRLTQGVEDELANARQ